MEQQDSQEQKLKVDKFADGNITCLKFAGSVDEDFDGKKLASTIKSGTLILDLADITKISSFGIREWVDFVTKASETAGSTYLIECAPKIVDQFNMVANFAGKGLVFSFYAPYQCDYCGEDTKVLFQVDNDAEVIKSMKPPERSCDNCSNPSYFDEDPSTYFSHIISQEAFELDPQVASFLATRLNYAVSDSARRLRAEKTVEGRATFLKITGDIDGAFPKDKLAEGLEGTVVVDLSGAGKIDPAGAAEWRGFLKQVSVHAERILLLGCPPAFMERLTAPEDLGDKAQVMTFSMPYTCTVCGTTAGHLIDVQEHYDVLKFATPPEMKCHDDKSATTCAASESLLSHLPQLPKVEVEKDLRKTIKDVQNRKPEKKQQATTMAEAAAGRQSSFATVFASLAGAAVVAAVMLIGYNYYQKTQSTQLVQARDTVGKKVGAAADERPTWITSDTRSSAYCTDEGGAVACVGVSAYLASQDDAREQAINSSLEEMANALALKIDDPLFASHVRGSYGNSRQAILSHFEQAREDKDGAKYDRARRDMLQGRAKVTAAFRLSGGAAVPSQPTDEYWEQYESLAGGSSYLVFVKFNLTPDGLKTLVDRYTKPAEALGAKALTVFPGIAWRYPDVQQGAILVGLAQGVMQAMGLAEEYIVLSVRDRKVVDAQDFAAKITEEFANLKKNGGDMKFEVKAGDGPTVTFNRPVPKDISDRPRAVGRGGGRGGARPSGVNIWDKTGGGNARDNPDE